MTVRMAAHCVWRPAFVTRRVFHAGLRAIRHRTHVPRHRQLLEEQGEQRDQCQQSAMVVTQVHLGMRPAKADKVYSDCVLNVSQLLMSPEANPALNQRERWAEVPCVNESGVAYPRAAFCSVSSPTCDAALSAESISPSCSQFNCACDLLPHTPAKQSACNS